MCSLYTWIDTACPSLVFGQHDSSRVVNIAMSGIFWVDLCSLWRPSYSLGILEHDSLSEIGEMS